MSAAASAAVVSRVSRTGDSTRGMGGILANPGPEGRSGADDRRRELPTCEGAAAPKGVAAPGAKDARSAAQVPPVATGDRRRDDDQYGRDRHRHDPTGPV